jgi:hypothetical protein
MKTRSFLCIFSALFLLTGVASTGFSQSSNCVVMEKQGNLVTVACPGEGSQVINMGGTADIYKPGDTVTVTGQPNKNREVGPKVR